MRNNPDYYLQYRKNVETEMVALGEAFHRNTPDSAAAKDVSCHPNHAVYPSLQRCSSVD